MAVQDWSTEQIEGEEEKEEKQHIFLWRSPRNTNEGLEI